MHFEVGQPVDFYLPPGLLAFLHSLIILCEMWLILVLPEGGSVA